MEICIAKEEHREIWNRYVLSKEKATVYHLFEWGKLIEEVYGHKKLYLISLERKNVSGILPLILIRPAFPIFPKKLVSLPFLDIAGIVSDSPEIEKELFLRALLVSKKAKAALELRQRCPLSVGNCNISRVSFILELPESASKLMNSFKSKLRSQIKRPIKEGMYVRIGGKEFIDDFYKVFSVNMRDLGSPVHSKKFIKKLFEYFPDITKIFVVYYRGIPVASSITVEFKDRIFNPWASFLRKYKRAAPNMLLYWKMLEYACEKGFKYFDFGRSRIGSGTYRFKKQWGAKEYPLFWYAKDYFDEKSKFYLFIKLWKKLPISLANLIGPYIRGSISL